MVWFLVISVGLVVGFGAGYLAPVVPSAVQARYLSIALMACLDSAFGGIRANLDGKYRTNIFISGFFTNMFLAAGLVFMGDRLGVSDLYLAGVAAMGIRIFQNIGIIRRRLFERMGMVERTAAPAPGLPQTMPPQQPPSAP